MTPKQMEELRAYAQELIDEQMEKIRLKLGIGIEGFQHGDSNVLFLEGTHRFPERRVEDERWEVRIFGYTVFVSQGELIPKSGGDPQTWNETTVGEYVELIRASNGPEAFNPGQLVNRIAYYQLSPSDLVDGYTRFRQTIYMNIPDYSFPVRLTLLVRDEVDGGGSSEFTDTLDFTSDAVQPYVINWDPPPGRRLVTATSLTRL